MLEEEEESDEEEPGSLEMGDDALAWMIGPTLLPNQFYATHWEKKPLHVKRGDPDYYKDVFSCKGDCKIPFFSKLNSKLHWLS